MNSAMSNIITLRNSFHSRKTWDIEFRRRQLLQLRNMIQDVDNRELLVKAVFEDLGKNRHEFEMMELFMVENELELAIANLDSWTKNEYVQRDASNIINQCYIRQDPKGVVFIISSWNYPVQLSLIPFISALTAGNCVILKPSELAAATASTLKKLLHQYLDDTF